jgi:hypothetical protein
MSSWHRSGARAQLDPPTGCSPSSRLWTTLCSTSPLPTCIALSLRAHVHRSDYPYPLCCLRIEEKSCHFTPSSAPASTTAPSDTVDGGHVKAPVVTMLMRRCVTVAYSLPPKPSWPPLELDQEPSHMPLLPQRVPPIAEPLQPSSDSLSSTVSTGETLCPRQPSLFPFGSPPPSTSSSATASGRGTTLPSQPHVHCRHPTAPRPNRQCPSPPYQLGPPHHRPLMELAGRHHPAPAAMPPGSPG